MDGGDRLRARRFGCVRRNSLLEAPVAERPGLCAARGPCCVTVTPALLNSLKQIIRLLWRSIRCGWPRGMRWDRRRGRGDDAVRRGRRRWWAAHCSPWWRRCCPRRLRWRTLYGERPCGGGSRRPRAARRTSGRPAGLPMSGARSANSHASEGGQGALRPRPGRRRPRSAAPALRTTLRGRLPVERRPDRPRWPRPCPGSGPRTPAAAASSRATAGSSSNGRARRCRTAPVGPCGSCTAWRCRRATESRRRSRARSRAKAARGLRWRWRTRGT